MSPSASASRPRISSSEARSRDRAALFGRRSAGAALVLLAASTPARSAEVDATRLEQCRRITDSLERLVCFDALASGGEASAAASSAEPKPAAPAYKAITLTDLLVDAKELRGQRVEVTGALQQLGELVMLKEELLSATGVFVEIKAIPREDRRRVFQLCGQGCTAIVRGQVATVMMNAGIKAERVEVP